MRLPRPPVVVLLALLAAGPPAARGEDRPKGIPNDPSKPLGTRVNQAIDSGVEWLRKQTFLPGNWADAVTGDRLYDPNSKGDPFVHPTGCTSLSLYALLKSGVPKDDPVVKKGFQWLRGASSSAQKGKSGGVGKAIANRIPGSTYELATLILAVEARANPHKMEKERERELRFRMKKGEKLNLNVKLDPEDEPWMRDLVAALRARLVGGQGWRYGQVAQTGFHQGTRGDRDLSATNLAMLALASAERCGFKQDDALYAGVLKWTLTMQEREGPEQKRWQPVTNKEDERYAPAMDRARGFCYLATGDDKEKRASGSMTCCGLANIALCTAFLEGRNSPLLTPELAAQAEKAWWDGVAWLDLWWTVSANPNATTGGYHYYYLYCLERACDLKRWNLLAGHPWYNLGAQVLVDDQNLASTGAWTKDDTHEPHDILNTCFALLFLNRSTMAITGED